MANDSVTQAATGWSPNLVIFTPGNDLK